MNTRPPQSPLLLRQLLDASIEGVLAFDRDCCYTAWNKAMERISGLSCSDVLGKSAFDVFPFLKETGEDKCFHEALAGNPSTSDNTPYTIPSTGKHGFFKGYYSPLRDDQNEIIGGVAVIHDITETMRAQLAAQEAHQQLTFHVENSPLAVIEWDGDARVSRWSESAERLFGWTAEEVLGKHVGDWHFVFDEDVDAVAQVTRRQRAGAELLGVQRNRNYTRDGSILFCEWYNSVLRDEAGKMLSILSLVLDVTAHKLAEEERAALLTRERDLRKQAEEADRLKDEFLATLSHELRTPLTSILGWASLIRNGDVDEENAANAIQIIERNARSQARLIDDLLDVSRIITGKLKLDVHPINLAPLVESALEALQPAADAKGISVETDVEGDCCLVSGDADRLRQVIWNLMMNAIKFTPRGGRVNVKLEVQCPKSNVQSRSTGESDEGQVEGGKGNGDVDSGRPSNLEDSTEQIEVKGKGEGGRGNLDREGQAPVNIDASSQEQTSASKVGQASDDAYPLPFPLDPPSSVRLTVSDTGDGIKSSFLPYVFHRFRQEESSISRKAGGLGLGLAVVRHLIELHGGTVSADSNGPGQGSTFVVELPLASDKLDTIPEKDASADEEPTLSKEEASQSSATLNGIRILLVEDDDDARILLTVLLESRGASVIAVASSAEALDVVQGPKTTVQSPTSQVQGPKSKVQSPTHDKASPLPLPLDPGSYDPSPGIDIVISDLGMPDEDGYDFIRKLRSLGSDASLITHDSSLSTDSSLSLPAIALTGYATDKDRERALSAGYQLHLAKPVEADELINSILSLVRQ